MNNKPVIYIREWLFNTGGGIIGKIWGGELEFVARTNEESFFFLMLKGDGNFSYLTGKHF